MEFPWRCRKKSTITTLLPEIQRRLWQWHAHSITTHSHLMQEKLKAYPPRSLCQQMVPNHIHKHTMPCPALGKISSHIIQQDSKLACWVFCVLGTFQKLEICSFFNVSNLHWTQIKAHAKIAAMRNTSLSEPTWQQVPKQSLILRFFVWLILYNKALKSLCWGFTTSNHIDLKKHQAHFRPAHDSQQHANLSTFMKIL